MFSEKHFQILQEINLRHFNTKDTAARLQVPPTLISHFLEELNDSEFIRLIKTFEGISDILLLPKGKATIDSPEYFLGKPMTNDKNYTWTGDRTAGDKIAGDKVMGNKVQIGTVQGDAVAGNKIVHSQDLAQAAKDIKALLNHLSGDYDTTKQSGKMQLGAKILEALESDVPMKKRFVKALKEGGTTALEEAIDHPLAKPVIAAVKGFLDEE